jgi:hypothetical protein
MNLERDDSGPNIGLWLGIAVGAAIGIGIAVSRGRKRSPWDSARKVASRISDHSGDLAATTNNIIDRVRVIYDEGCKVVEEAGELWAHGRKLVSR